jgi:phosphoglycolate phosphatase-like HAD superfamily hydrolase
VQPDVPDDDRPIAVVDIDGVVADVRHRLHHIEGRRKHWGAFFAGAGEDPPHPEGLAVVATLAADHEVVFLTGRPERLRAVTEEWLDAHGIGGRRLVMRDARDHRPAPVFKLDEIARLAGSRSVAIVVDDDARVLAALRAAGHAVFAAEWERRTATEDSALHQAQHGDGLT